MQIINNRFLSLYDYNFLIVNQMRGLVMWVYGTAMWGRACMPGGIWLGNMPIIPIPLHPLTLSPHASLAHLMLAHSPWVPHLRPWATYRSVIPFHSISFHSLTLYAQTHLLSTPDQSQLRINSISYVEICL